MDRKRPRPAGPGDPGGDGPGDAPAPPGDLPASNRIGPFFVESVMGRDDVEVLCLARDTAHDERYVTLRLLPLVMIRNAPAMDVLRDFAERAATGSNNWPYIAHRKLCMVRTASQGKKTHNHRSYYDLVHWLLRMRRTYHRRSHPAKKRQRTRRVPMPPSTFACG